MAVAQRVLVVEDNPDARKFLAQILLATGYRVDSAEDGADALQKATQARYDLIVSDIEMPRMDGITAAQRLRELEASEGRRSTPIVVVTAQDNVDTRARAAAAGVNAFLAKPVRSKNLISVVREHIDETSTVLVVDDAEQNRSLITAWIETRPYTQVIVADRAGAAINIVRGQRVDLLLLDMVMPGIDGYAAARLLRALPEAKDLPIVAITAKVGDAERDACLAAGCSDYLPKPLAMTSLLGLVERYARPLPASALKPQEPVEAAFELDEHAAALVPVFLDNRRAEIVLLRAALSMKDFPKLTTLGHNLKGSGGSYGFPLISEIGGVMESAAKRQDVATLKTQIERLSAYLAEVTSARQSA